MKSYLLVPMLLLNLTGCTEHQTSDLASAPMQSVYVIGTWGRDGETGGINRNIIPRLQDHLVPLGVPLENIYAQSWSSSAATDDIPGNVPDTDRHIQRFQGRLRGTPSYLALIGHSFGGWAAARLSTTIPYKTNELFLLDPVIMGGYRDRDNERLVKANYGISFYQAETVVSINPCIDGQIAEVSTAPLNDCKGLGALSCGVKLNGLSEGNHKVTYRRKVDGTDKRISCDLIGKKKVRISHDTIDDDEFLQEIIISRIVASITALQRRTAAFFPFYGSKATTAADLNGDGLDDLVVTNDQLIAVKYNQGNNQFGPNTIVLNEPYYGSKISSFADINGDGYDDAIVVNDSEIIVRHNDKQGSFSERISLLNIPYYGSKTTTFADVNGDGYADAIVVNDNQVVVRYNNQSGQFLPNKVVIDFPYYGSRLTGFADINADGFADALVVNDDRVVVRLNDQLGGFGAEQTFSEYPYFGSVATFLGDLNGDGASDLVVYNGDGQVVRYNLQGDGLSPNVNLLLEPR